MSGSNVDRDEREWRLVWYYVAVLVAVTVWLVGCYELVCRVIN